MALRCRAHISKATGLSAPLPPRALASGGEGSGVGGRLRSPQRPPPGTSPSAPRHPPHRRSASKTRVNALSAGGGMVPAAPSRISKRCVHALAPSRGRQRLGSCQKIHLEYAGFPRSRGRTDRVTKRRTPQKKKPRACAGLKRIRAGWKPDQFAAAALRSSTTEPVVMSTSLLSCRNRAPTMTVMIATTIGYQRPK
jgi:hypothetical protein